MRWAAGSTKGFAHIGVLQVLEEHHIPIDLIAGSSIGAIVASIYAAGTDLHLLEKFVLQMTYATIWTSASWERAA